MHLEAIDHNMFQITLRLGLLREFSFYLAGGTGLALQIGHRRSLDFDFFTSIDFSPEELSSLIRKNKILAEGEIHRHGTLHCIIEGIKFSFMFYDAPLLFPLKEFNTISISDWRDIVTEKFRTVSDRGQKKDFYDLYFGVQQIGVNNIVEFAFKKFGKNVNYSHILKGITYFEDAERDPDPVLLNKTVSWEEVKVFFTTNIQDFIDAFRRLPM